MTPITHQFGLPVVVVFDCSCLVVGLRWLWTTTQQMVGVCVISWCSWSARGRGCVCFGTVHVPHVSVFSDVYMFGPLSFGPLSFGKT